MNRTKNSAINASVATLVKVVYIIVNFITRTVFIKTLGAEYLGVNGLFTNILLILSFAELGIGNAIIFKLYKPIAEDNQERIKTLLHFYKKAYFLIGLFILGVGILIIPFLDVIIKEAPNIKESLVYIYILFLTNTTISYFFIYKRSIITGYQKEYVLNIISLIINVLQSVFQIIILFITHNFVLFLLIQILFTVLNNLLISIIADKMYPYIKEKDYQKMDKEEQKSIFNDVKSLVLYKFGYILSNGTDNIIISTFLGVKAVGLLSNYTTVTTAITSLLSSLFNSLTASIGNLNTIKDSSRKESVFYQILFLSFIIYGYISIATTLLINDFITIWLGSNYLLSFSVCIAIGFNLFVDGMRFVNYSYRNTLGLFKKGRFAPLISSLSNIVLSIILVKYIGVFGVLIATGITRLLILTWYDPYLIHKNEFKTSSSRFYKTYLYYLLITVLAFIVCYKIISLINISGMLGFVIDGLIISLIVFIIFIVATYKSDEFIKVKERMFKLVKRV